MKKKLTILIPLLAVFILIAVAGTIADSGTNSSAVIGQVQSLEVQKKAVLDAIAKRDTKTADSAYNNLLTEFAKSPGLSEVLYSISIEYQYKYWNSMKANEIHKYVIEHYQNTKYAMLSGVELIRSQLRSGKNADSDVEKWISMYKNRKDLASDLPNSIYLIAQAYSNNKKDSKALPLFEYIAKTDPKSLYGTLSQMRIDAINGTYDAADVVADYLIARYRDNEDVKQAIRSLAEYYRAKKEYDRAIHFYSSEIENRTNLEDPVKPYCEMIYCAIDMNDINNARSLIDEMQKSLAGNTKLARANFDIANYFLNSGDSASALRLHKYNVVNNTDALESLWSQAAIVWYYVRAGDEENAYIEYDKMLAIYKDHKTLPKEIFQIGDIYLEMDNSEKARSLYQQVLDEWPESEYVFNAKTGLIKADIKDDKDADALAAIDILIADYKDKNILPPTVLNLGRLYWLQANEIRAGERTQAGENTKEVLTENVIQKYLNAREIWNKLLSELPDSQTAGEATFMVAETHNTLDETQQALPLYQSFLDKWPDFDYSWVAQNRIIKIYKKDGLNSSKSGFNSEDLIIAGYETLVEKFPDSTGAEDARKKLESYRKQKQFENINPQSMTNEQIYDLAKQIVEEGGSK